MLAAVVAGAGVAFGARAPAPAPAAPLADVPAWRQVLLDLGVRDIVFAVRPIYEDGHYYANFGHWSLKPGQMMHAPNGGKLCRLDVAAGTVAALLDDPMGNVRDPTVHYDGKRILFSYRKGGTKHYHLYEIGADGSGLKQLTDGDFDDIEPTYLPDGGILFPSSRCNRFVACWYTPVALLHRCDANGRNIQALTCNVVHDNTPAVLPDGRILYTRWEYVDRAPQKYHGLWTMNPDGTGQMVYFGNSSDNPWVLMIDGQAVPGTDEVVAIFSPRHGNREHEGHVTIVRPNAGPDSASAARQISPPVKIAGGWMGGPVGFRDPWPVSADWFLAAKAKSLVLLNRDGRCQEIHAAGELLHEPRPLVPRPRERTIPPRSDFRQRTGRLVLADAAVGRNMGDVRPGEVRRLLVLEQLPKPVNFSGVQQTMSMDGTFTLKRILGTVPVEADGSAYFEAPALRSLYFAAQDAAGRTVKRMQSFCTVMPGEALSCVGCHERREHSAAVKGNLLATRRPPSPIEPLAGVPDVLDYPRDVQPILDRHCLKCHSAEKAAGRVVLTGDHNEWFSQSFYTLFARDQVSDSWGYAEDGNHEARKFGSPASALMKKVTPDVQGKTHHDVKLLPAEVRLLQLWIDTGATYPGTYAALNGGTVTVNTRPINEVFGRRCAACHKTKFDSLGAVVGKRQSHGNVPRRCLTLFNLSRPDKSPILLAPLARDANGWDICRKEPAGAPVFRDAADADYQAILKTIGTAADHLAGKRFDMPGFRPNEHYLRELRRYGVLTAELEGADPYALDRAYWRSLWHRPAAPAAAEGVGPYSHQGG
jgi:hypothetical protein